MIYGASVAIPWHIKGKSCCKEFRVCWTSVCLCVDYAVSEPMGEHEGEKKRRDVPVFILLLFKC